MKKRILKLFFYAGLVTTLTASALGIAKQTYADFPDDVNSVLKTRYGKIGEASYKPFVVISEEEIKTAPPPVQEPPYVPPTEEQIAASQKEQTRPAFAEMTAEAKEAAQDRLETVKVALEKGEKFDSVFGRLGIVRGDFPFIRHEINRHFGERSKHLKPGHQFYAVKDKNTGALQALFFRSGDDGLIMVWDVFTSSGKQLSKELAAFVSQDEVEKAVAEAKTESQQSPASEIKAQAPTDSKTVSAVEKTPAKRQAQEPQKRVESKKRTKRGKNFTAKEFALRTQTQTSFLMTDPLGPGKSFSQTLADVKAPAYVLVQLQKMFPDINLSAMTRGATVELQLAEQMLPDGTRAGQGIVTDARLTINGKAHEAHRVNVLDGKVFDYVDENGHSLKRFLEPLPGSRVTGEFGEWRESTKMGWRGHKHKAVDRGAPAGTPIYAPSGGIITFAGYDGEFDYAVKYEFGDGLDAIWGHCFPGSAPPVGTVFKAGDRIARVGPQGPKSTGTHLHEQNNVNGVPVPPLRRLPPLRGAKLAALKTQIAQFERNHELALAQKQEEIAKAERARLAEEARQHQAELDMTPVFRLPEKIKAAAVEMTGRKIIDGQDLHEAIVAYRAMKNARKETVALLSPVVERVVSSLSDPVAKSGESEDENLSSAVVGNDNKSLAGAKELTIPKKAREISVVRSSLYEKKGQPTPYTSRVAQILAKQTAYFPSRRDDRRSLAKGRGHHC